MKFFLKTIFANAFLLSVLALNTSLADEPSVSDYSVLPETITSITVPDADILVIIDNSTSMQNAVDGSNLTNGASDTSSRSYILRTAMTTVLEGLKGKVNMGLMAFQTKLPAGMYAGGDNNPLRGGGALHQIVAPLSGTHLDSMKEALLTENSATSNTILSVDHTAMEGALLHALEYFNGTLTGTTSNTIINRDGIEVTLNETGLDLADIYISPQACAANPAVILVTDGQPSSDPTDLRHHNDCTSSNDLTCTREAVKVLELAGIKTYVIGFADASLKTNLDLIAADGGTTSSYAANNNATLVDAFTDIIQDVIPSAGSSSGISVVASSSDAAGSVVQAIYNPELSGTDPDDPDETVSIAWTSTLSAFFLDEYGFLREDNSNSGTAGKLDGYGTDKAFVLALEDIDTDGDGFDDNKEVRARYLDPTGFGTPSFNINEDSTTFELADLNPIWEAGEQIGQFYDESQSDSFNDSVADIYGSLNRGYNNIASNSNGYRRIYSWIQNDPASTDSGDLDQGIQIKFIYDNSETDTINDTNYTLLGVDDEGDAEEIIRFIRGAENIIGFRNRSTAEQTYLLGDIVHSTAAQVDAPNNVFNTRFRDDSYSAFKEFYEDRRRMVYVGSNDGLLHAFNGGFWDGENAQLNLIAPNNGADNTAHPLGAEIWAYAPMNLLPHLQWLTNTSYKSSGHVAYMDGPVQIFDVQAFTDDDTHINKWGTILVAGMYFGGGEFDDVDPDADGLDDNFTARSAYVIIDVTDPSQEPVVIAEVTHEMLGFTTSEPTVMKEGDDWYLMFGSGPNDLATGTAIEEEEYYTNGSNGIPFLVPAVPQEPRIYRYKLNDGERGFASDGDGDDTIGTDDGFVGDMIAHDWDSDYSHDAAYFGIITGTEETPSGGMYRYVADHELASSPKVKPLIQSLGQPVVDRPLLKSYAGKDWVLFGTGRYLTAKDAENDSQNTFYGVIESRDDYGTVATSSILNVTNVDVSAELKDTNGDVTQVGGVLSATVGGETTFSGLRSHILSDSAVNGWEYDFELIPSPSEKNSAPPLSFKSLLFYTYYKPPDVDDVQCDAEFGTSYLNVVDLVTGTASFTKDFEGPLGLDGSNIEKTALIGDGYANQSYLFVGPDPETGKTRILIKTPLSTGEIADTEIEIPPSPNGRTSWRELEIQ